MFQNQKVAQSLSQWQGHLLSCQVTAIERDLRILNPEFFSGQTRKNAQHPEKYSEGLIFWKKWESTKIFRKILKCTSKIQKSTGGKNTKNPGKYAKVGKIFRNLKKIVVSPKKRSSLHYDLKKSHHFSWLKNPEKYSTVGKILHTSSEQNLEK